MFGNVVNCFLKPEETVSACTKASRRAPHISLIDSALPYRQCLNWSVKNFARTNPCNRLPTHNQYKTAGRCFSKYGRLETKGQRQVRYCRLQSCAWFTKSDCDYNQKPDIENRDHFALILLLVIEPVFKVCLFSAPQRIQTDSKIGDLSVHELHLVSVWSDYGLWWWWQWWQQRW